MHTATPSLTPMTDPTGNNWAWTPQTAARELVEEMLIRFVSRCPDAARFGERCLSETGTRISDWVGVILTPDTEEIRARLDAAGYQPRDTEFVDADIHYAFSQPAAVLPDILLTDSDRMSVGLQIDSVADFFAATGLPGVHAIQGEPLARARWARVFDADNAAMWVFERHGYDGYHLAAEPAEHRIAALHHAERFRSRPKGHSADPAAFDELDRALDAAAEELGKDWAADLFIAAETERFAADHCAASPQTARQRKAGLGVANTDHLVYAASHAGLPRTLDLFARLGFQAREALGLPDGDTATVLQQPTNGTVVAVVAPATPEPSPAGSWVALLGDSVISSGPVGLALRGDTDALARQLDLTAAGPAKISPLPIPGDAVDEAAAAGRLHGGFAHSLRNGGQIGPVLTVVSRADATRAVTPEQLAWRTPGA